MHLITGRLKIMHIMNILIIVLVVSLQCPVSLGHIISFDRKGIVERRSSLHASKRSLTVKCAISLKDDDREDCIAKSINFHELEGRNHNSLTATYEKPAFYQELDEMVRVNMEPEQPISSLMSAILSRIRQNDSKNRIHRKVQEWRMKVLRSHGRQSAKLGNVHHKEGKIYRHIFVG